LGTLTLRPVKDELRQLFAAYGAVKHVSIMTDRYSGQPRASAFVEMASVGNADRTESYYSTAARWTLMRHVAGQSARVAAGKAENDVEAADAGSNQHPIGANNVQFNYGKDNADHRLRCDSSRRRPCLLDICAACADGLARMRRSGGILSFRCSISLGAV
jgi:RNA recognition motif-containing protein